MRVLLYFADAHRRADYEDERNPWLQWIKGLGKKVDCYSRYFTEYPSTYRWTLSFFMMTSFIDGHQDYEYIKQKKSERLPSNKFAFENRLKALGYNFRISETRNTYGWDYYNTVGEDGFVHRVGQVMNREDFLAEVPENTVDLIYDINFHDRLFRCSNTFNEKLRCYKRDFELASEILDQEIIKEYDYIIIFADHGYADFIHRPEGDYWHDDYNQHNKKWRGEIDEFNLGNPLHHSSPILYVIHNKVDGVVETNDSLVNQVDFSNYIFHLIKGDVDYLKNSSRPYIVVGGASVYERRYPTKYYIVTKDNFKSFYLDRQYKYGFNGVGMITNFGDPKPEVYEMTQDDWDILYSESPYVCKIFDYEDYKLNDTES